MHGRTKVLLTTKLNIFSLQSIAKCSDTD